MKLTREKTLWLPTSYDATPVKQKNNRKLKTYLLNTSSKKSNTTASNQGSRVRPLDMKPFTITIDESVIDDFASHQLRYGNWNKILHLKPYYSFDPKSMANVLEEFKREIGKMEGKRKEFRPEGWKGDKASLHAIIEFGDKLHGIHSHALVRTWLTDVELDTAWFRANLWGTEQRRIKLLKERAAKRVRKGYVEVLDIHLAQDAWKAVRYVVGNELVYSQIDAENIDTSYSTDLVCKLYGGYKPTKTQEQKNDDQDNLHDKRTRRRPKSITETHLEPYKRTSHTINQSRKSS